MAVLGHHLVEDLDKVVVLVEGLGRGRHFGGCSDRKAFRRRFGLEIAEYVREGGTGIVQDFLDSSQCLVHSGYG